MADCTDPRNDLGSTRSSACKGLICTASDWESWRRRAQDFERAAKHVLEERARLSALGKSSPELDRAATELLVWIGEVRVWMVIENKWYDDDQVSHLAAYVARACALVSRANEAIAALGGRPVTVEGVPSVQWRKALYAAAILSVIAFGVYWAVYARPAALASSSKRPPRRRDVDDQLVRAAIFDRDHGEAHAWLPPLKAVPYQRTTELERSDLRDLLLQK